MIATFADDGPLKRSGVKVERSNIEKLTQAIGGDFKLLPTFREHGHTPFDMTQSFYKLIFEGTNKN